MLSEKAIKDIKDEATKYAFEKGYPHAEVSSEIYNDYYHGLLRGLEISSGFAEWVNYYNYQYDNRNKLWDQSDVNPHYTTSELFEKYLETRK